MLLIQYMPSRVPPELECLTVLCADRFDLASRHLCCIEYMLVGMRKTYIYIYMYTHTCMHMHMYVLYMYAHTWLHALHVVYTHA